MLNILSLVTFLLNSALNCKQKQLIEHLGVKGLFFWWGEEVKLNT